MNRRRLIGVFATASLFRAAGEPLSTRFRKQSPYEPLLRHIERGNDEFPLEKQAFQAASHLKRLMERRSLPLAAGFSGISPLPSRYTPVAEGVSKAEFDLSNSRFEDGLKNWLDSLGEIRSARFFVLANDLVRYEIASGNQYRVGLWKQTWSGDELARFSPIEEMMTEAPQPLFRDITGFAFAGLDSFERQLVRGIPYWRARLDSASGIDVQGNNGIAVADIDGDGWDEIYVCQPGGLPNRLYRNRPNGKMDDITEEAGLGVLDDTSAALFVDFRNSGRRDLVILRAAGPLLFLNQGNGRFVPKLDAFRFRTAPQGTFTGMAAADYDRDGRVDLYVCTYIYTQNSDQYRYPVPFHDAQNGPPNFLFQNRLTTDGDGIFEDVTEATGMNQNNNRYSFAPAWCDYDGDGWPDQVANDFGRNNLYKNEGGHFRDVAADAGVEDIGPGMSASWFDYDGDGRPDLYISNMWTDAGQRINSQRQFEPKGAYRRHAKGNSLYRNRGDGTFEETGPAQGVEMGRWAWSSGGIDFDNDGAPEIFITTGMITNTVETDLSSFFWRHVVACSPVTEKSEPAYENGWNAISQIMRENYSYNGREPNVLYVRRNDRYYDFSGISGLDRAEDSRAFAVADLDGDGNLDLVLKSRLGPQVRVYQNNCGAGRKSLAIRLRGVESNRDAICARVEADGAVKFVQAGSGYISQHTKNIFFGLGNAEKARTVRVHWPSGLQQEFHDLSAGFRHEITEHSDRVQSTPFLARRELPQSVAHGQNEPEFADTWLLEPVPLPERLGAPGFVLLAEPISEERRAWCALFRRYLFDWHADHELPVWLLVDERGMAHKIYFSPPEPDDLKRMRDANRMALPFKGRYYTPPQRNFLKLGVAFYWAGYPEQALRYLEEAPQEDYKVLLAIGQIHLEADRSQPARRYLERALALRPESRSALVGAGRMYLKLGDPAMAEEIFRRALRADAKNADAANQLGLILAEKGNSGEARHWYEEAIAAQRDHAEAINNLGVLYQNIGQPNDAVAALRYGIEVAPDYDLLFLNLARVYVKTGNRDKAREVMERLLARKPDSQMAKEAIRELEAR